LPDEQHENDRQQRHDQEPEHWRQESQPVNVLGFL
jgi:hypothetical protein